MGYQLTLFLMNVDVISTASRNRLDSSPNKIAEIFAMKANYQDRQDTPEEDICCPNNPKFLGVLSRAIIDIPKNDKDNQKSRHQKCTHKLNSCVCDGLVVFVIIDWQFLLGTVHKLHQHTRGEEVGKMLMVCEGGGGVGHLLSLEEK